MTHKILKSALLPYPGSLDDAKRAFSALVNKQIEELRAWHAHDLKARATPPLPAKPVWRDFHKPAVITAKMTETEKTAAHFAANKRATDLWSKAHVVWDKERLERHEPYPPPGAHPDVEAAIKTTVNSDGSTSYEADFEIQDDDPTPESILADKKNALLHKIVEAETAALDRMQPPVGKRRAANLKEAAIRKADLARWTNQTKGMAPSDIAKLDYAVEVAKGRDPADTRFLADQQARAERTEALMHAAAQAMSDIEDLTLDNIDNYQLPDFG
jgi:hypothetical protein